jgi:intein-encoded DNA endonuclease-like protein
MKPIETKKKWGEVAKLKIRYTEIKKQNFNYSKERGRIEERHELRPSKNGISIL